MLLLGGPHYCLLLATARHVVVLVGSVFVLASTAIEIVPLPAVKAPVKEIVVIPAGAAIASQVLGRKETDTSPMWAIFELHCE